MDSGCLAILAAGMSKPGHQNQHCNGEASTSGNCTRFHFTRAPKLPLLKRKLPSPRICDLSDPKLPDNKPSCTPQNRPVGRETVVPCVGIQPGLQLITKPLQRVRRPPVTQRLSACKSLGAPSALRGIALGSEPEELPER